MSDPKGFLKFKRETPHRRPAPDRLHDWKEFYLPLDESELRKQAARCMDCGVPFCHGPQGCPVENQIPDWNELVWLGRWKQALRALHSTNNFPEFTGRLCPAPCESACVLGINADPVAIRVIEQNIVDRGFDEGLVEPVLPRRKTGRRVAIVGSGPAGLAAAQQLARAGHEVVVFEKADKVGGLLRYGIPDFKMEKWVLDRRLEQMRAEGVEFRVSCAVGGAAQLSELRARFDAVGLAVGAEAPRDIVIPGRSLAGIHFAMDYLIEGNRATGGAPGQGAGPAITAAGKNVVILGGGDTGSDCLGTVLRQGAKSVHQFEILPRPPAARDSSTPWPLWPLQLRTSHAHEEGGMRDWSLSTEEFLGKDGRVTGLRARQVSMVGGKFAPVSGAPGVELACELVLIAAGFTGAVSAGLLDELGVKLSDRGNVAVDERFMTSVPGIFSSGDATRGASLIVWAIAEGRRMAAGDRRVCLHAGATFHLRRSPGLTIEVTLSPGSSCAQSTTWLSF